MAITARRLRRLEAWSDWQGSGGVRQAVIDDAISARASVSLENENLSVTLPLDSSSAAQLAARKIIRCDQDDTTFDEYRIIDRGTDDEQGVLVITAAPFRVTDLQGAGLISRKDSDGVTLFDFEVLGLTPAEIIQNWVMPALTAAGFGWLSPGIIIPTARLDMTFAWDTPLAVLLRLASATQCELDIRQRIDALDRSGVATWSQQVYSARDFFAGAYASARAERGDAMFGLNIDPTTDANYTSIDYAWYVGAASAEGGSLWIYENGTLIGQFGEWRPNDFLEVTYDNGNIRYLHNGVQARILGVSAGLSFHFDSSFYSQAALRDLRFGPKTNPAAAEFVASGGINLIRTGYAIDLIPKVNTLAQQADLRVDKNLINVTKSESSIDQATRIYPQGADMGDGMRATLARAKWEVLSKTGGIIGLKDPAGGAGPIQVNGQLAAGGQLVGYWPFDDGTLNDKSGFGNNGSFPGGGAIVVGGGRFGDAIALDGLNDYVQVSDSLALRYTGGDFSAAAWIKPDITEQNSGYIFSKPWNDSGQYNWQMVYDGSIGILQVYLQGATGFNSGSVSVPRDGKWHHVAFTLDASRNVLIYVDGVLARSEVHAITDWTPSAGVLARALCIGTLYPYGGGWGGDTGYSFGGMIDDARVYASKLSATDIARLARMPLVPAFFREPDGTMRQVIDSSATNQTVTLATAPGGELAVGDLIEFRADASGRDLTYLEDPGAVAAYGVKSAVKEVADVPATNNLVKNAAMRTWPGGAGSLPTNWTAVGAPTIAKQTAAPFTAIGGQSIKVTSTADGQGVVSDGIPIFPTATNPYLSGYAKIWVASGNARVELVVSTPSGTKVFPLLPDVAAPTSLGQWFDVGAAGYDANAVGATAAAIRIVQNGTAGSVFYIDAAQLTTTPTQEPWFEGAGGTRLWQEANEALRTGAAPLVSYTVPLADLEAYDPATWSESALILGANAHIVDSRLGIDIITRIVGIERDYLNPQSISVTLSNRFDDLTDILAGVSRPQRVVPGGPSIGKEEPTLGVQRPMAIVDFDAVGHPQINLIGVGATGSMKLEVGTSAPSDAAVEATTPIQGSAALISYSTPLIGPGGLLYVRAFAYSGASGTGTRSERLDVIATRQGTAAASAPRAEIGVQAESQTSITHRLTGTLGVGGTAPLQYRYRYDTNGVTGTWSSWAALGSYQDLVRAKNNFYQQQLVAQVRDSSSTPVESDFVYADISGRFEALEPTGGRINHGVPMDTAYSIFQYGGDTAVGVIETAGQSFTNGNMLDASRRVVNVYRSSTVEPATNLFKKGSDSAADVVTTSTRTFVDPNTATQVDSSGRIVGVYRFGVIEPVNNLMKVGDTLTGPILIVGSGEMLQIKGQSAGNPIYMAWRNSAGTRRGWIGYGTGDSATLSISNEEASSDIDIYTTAVLRARFASAGGLLLGAWKIGGGLVAIGTPVSSGLDVIATSGVQIAQFWDDNELTNARFQLTRSGLLQINSQSATTPGTATTYAIQLRVSGINRLTFGADGSYGYIQTFSSQPLYLNQQGNAVKIGSSGLQLPSGGGVQSDYFYATLNYGHGMVGLYDATKYRLVYAMGAAYLMPVDGSALTGLYGIFFGYDSTTGGYKNITGWNLGHGMGVAANGVVQTYLGSGIYALGSAIIKGAIYAGAYAGGARNDGDIVTRRSATTGVVYFGDASSKYLYYDGTNFYLSGGNLVAPDFVLA